MRILKEVKKYEPDLNMLRWRIEDVVRPTWSLFGATEFEVPPCLLEVRMSKTTFEVIKEHSNVCVKRSNTSTEETPTIFGVNILIDDRLETGEAQLWRNEG